jgi:hypothetical protein
MARPHSSRSRGSKLAAATSTGDREGEGDTGEAEHASAKRYPTRRSTAVTSKPIATTKKPTIATAKKPTFENFTPTLKSTTALKPTTTSKPSTRSQKAVVDAELGSQTQANRKTGTGTPAKVKGKTGTKVKMEAKMKAPRKKHKSATATGGKGEKQIKISDQKWQDLKGFGSFIGEYEAGRLRSC